MLLFYHMNIKQEVVLMTSFASNKIKKTISKLNLNLSDYTNYFCKLDNPSNYFYKFDPMHLSEKGHKLVYNNIVNEINF